MLSIKNCYETLKTNGLKINNEELKELREYLYFLANLNNSIINENQ